MLIPLRLLKLFYKWGELVHLYVLVALSLWYHVNVVWYSNPLVEGISSVFARFCPLPCLGSPTRGSGLMLGALYVRIQSLYSVHFMKDCDKLVYEFRRQLIITFAKKTNLYIKLLYVHFKVYILLSLSLQIISLYNGWLFDDSLVSYFLTYRKILYF